MMHPAHVVTTTLHGSTEEAEAVVVVVHGVGFGPATFLPVVHHLRPWVAVLGITRPGYHGNTPEVLPSLDEQVKMVASILETLPKGCPVTLAGASGGATIGLALAVARPELMHAAVLHEPLVGAAAPTLHDQIQRSARTVESDGDAAAFLERLVGAPAWSALDGDLRHDATRHASVVRHEAGCFADFSPPTMGPEQFAGRRIVVTVGAESGAARHEAAAVLAAHGASVQVVEGAGHLVQIESPRRWADIVLTAVRS
jgi:pimeloyl-ACP methyl ester carboxylesterase